MPIIDVEQGSAEWLNMRSGMVTGSRMADVMNKLKSGKPGAKRENYLMEVVVERLTGLHLEHFVSPSMEWGTQQEPFARAAYELLTDCTVEDAGFAMHSKIKWFGASPDGLIGTDGVLEIKCPDSDTHLKYILDGVVPDEYLPQIKAEMACSERQWCDFVSYDPRMPEHLQLFVRRHERDEPMILEMEKEVEQFLAEVETMIETINKKACVSWPHREPF